jgi:hypothetical protein
MREFYLNYGERILKFTSEDWVDALLFCLVHLEREASFEGKNWMEMQGAY